LLPSSIATKVPRDGTRYSADLRRGMRFGVPERSAVREDVS
jgi:hypothetical protein